jgi:nicotinamidase-related amidase
MERGFMKRALLVIDVQNEYFTGQLPVTYPDGSLENILKAMDTASQQDIPIIVVQHTEPEENPSSFKKGSQEWELHPEIAKHSCSLFIEKNLPGSFTSTALEGWLRAQGVDTVVISGYMTQVCCDTTARQAVHLGFSVEFLSDSTGTLAFENEVGNATAEELHRATLVNQNLFFGKVMSTSDWIKNLP